MPWHFGLTSMTTSTLPQLGLVELLETGFYPRYIRRLRPTLANQVAQYAAAVEDMFPAGTRMTRPGGGNVLWIQLPSRLDGTTLYRRALEKGTTSCQGKSSPSAVGTGASFNWLAPLRFGSGDFAVGKRLERSASGRVPFT